MIKMENGVLRPQSTNVQLECGTRQSQFGKLSSELLELLARNLNISDYLNFRSLCKESHAAAPLPITSRLENNTSSSPWLRFLKNVDSILNLVDPIQNNTLFMKIPQHLVGAHMAFSNSEGVVLWKSISDFYYHNPFTEASGEYRTYDDIPSLGNLVLTTFPASSYSTTVGIYNYVHHTRICLFRSIDQMWRSWFLHNDIPFFPSSRNPIYRNENFYFLDQTGSLGVFKPTEYEPIQEEPIQEARTWDIRSGPHGLCEAFYGNYLVECDGELLAIFLGSLGKQVQIFRLNDLSRKWVRVDTLKKHILFLSRFKGRGVLYYSLKTRKYHALGSDESFDDLYGSKGMMDATWIFPSC